jgi:hypothetical protein
MKKDFENSIKTLSSRAKRVLSDLGVADKDSLLNIAREDLIKVRGCGNKTITEIEVFQRSLNDSVQTSQVLNALAVYDNITSDAFDALLGVLSKRSRNILRSLDINDLKDFMVVNSDQLLNCRHCGQKTINEILTIQSEIKSFIPHQINEQDFLKPEDLIKAPYFKRISTVGRKKNSGDIQDIFADVHNPAPWLYHWINELSQSKKQAQTFKLRKGMAGLPPMTLNATGEQIGVTKERVRQMVMQIEKAATRQQHRLKPIIEKAAEIVETNGGMVSLEEFTKILLCKGQDGEQLKHATGL